MANWRSHRETGHFFWSKIGHFRRFGTTKMRERLSRGLDVKWHIPFTCLDASKSGFLLEFTAKSGFPSGHD